VVTTIRCVALFCIFLAFIAYSRSTVVCNFALSSLLLISLSLCLLSAGLYCFDGSPIMLLNEQVVSYLLFSQQL